MGDDVAAVAPVEPVVEAEAPAEGVEAKPKAPPKPRTVDDDIEDVFKKAGGLKYKAGGKEKAVTTAADLRRLLSRVDGTDTAATEAAKRAQRADKIEQSIAQLEKLPRAERIKHLKEMGINPQVVREAFEDDILAEESRAAEQAKLSDGERRLQAELEEKNERLSQYDKQRAAWEEEQKHNAHVEQVNAIGKRMGDAAVKALTSAKIDPTHVNHFLPAIATRLDQAARLEALNPDYKLDEEAITELVISEHASLADQFYGGLEIPALSERLAAIEVDDPAKPGHKTTRLRLLMLHEAARIKATLNGTVAPTTTRPASTQTKGETDIEKLARARTFGGGGW